MSVERERAILGRLLGEVTEQCVYCQCHGDSCKKDDEKCALTGPLRARCNSYECLIAHDIQQKKFERDSRRARSVRRNTRRAA